MSRKYFGTDGIRGRVGEKPLTPEFALKLGWAAGRVLGGEPGRQVLIGKDTRRSGYLFESALEAGFSAAGMDVGLLGPLPTPGVSVLTKALKACAGVVISASHNPHYDNGVKFFGADGGKLNDAVELEIEALLEQELSCVEPEKVGAARRIGNAVELYVSHCLIAYRGPRLDGMRIVVDCANGAAYQVAPETLRRLGAKVVAIHNQPDGFNINDHCGSTHLDSLSRAVVEHGAELGIALDGDADRCLMVDHQGREVDGDEILYILASDRLRRQLLQGPVVGTLMSNLGLQNALQDRGVAFRRAKVGDRYVLEMLRAEGGLLGGETSGHTLCLDRSATGDGMVTALQVLEVLAETGRTLRELASGMQKYPQVLINVPVAGKAAPVLEAASVKASVKEAESGLGQRGRVLLRASGTEPLVRVMVEADARELAESSARMIADRVREAANSIAAAA
ncbi:phosphoglucosamine mutase [Solimonas fluminis]|uniref:Phosphoglucosamine mutase n=1 Tax=Solimonas fluminis TaxID=2086571 RepID=A0A2S5TD91_9GAMM|nr:phosphoglucosamine mutase [Solimonas fluminis]PPE72847.1 phosphoglucosamine mutase [Solimonas fluminis]